MGFSIEIRYNLYAAMVVANFKIEVTHLRMLTNSGLISHAGLPKVHKYTKPVYPRFLTAFTAHYPYGGAYYKIVFYLIT